MHVPTAVTSVLTIPGEKGPEGRGCSPLQAHLPQLSHCTQADLANCADTHN